MTAITVAAIQYDMAWEDPAINFGAVRGYLDQAMTNGPELIILPEMFATGFSMASKRMANYAEHVREFLIEEAQQRRVAIGGGYAEPADPLPRNTFSIFSPEGDEVLRYHKIHPFTYGGESEHYGSGETVETVSISGVRVTVLICYDLRFPEVFRAATDRTDLFVVVASWPATRSAHWRALLRARAIENQCYVCGVNRVGSGGGLDYDGNSVMIDPQGKELCEKVGAAGVLSAVVDPAYVAETRKRFPFQTDRREDLYTALRGTSRSNA